LSTLLKESLDSIFVDILESNLFDQVKNEFKNLKEINEKISQENKKLEKENQTLKEEIKNPKLTDFSEIIEKTNIILQ
jgi:regulator of replication initiation timing